MKAVFIYPIGDSDKSHTKNPYISNFITALNKQVKVVNYKEKNRLGIIDAYRYFFKSDIFILNWTENIPSMKFGILQFISFVFLPFVIKLFNKEFIWVLHNKKPHSEGSFMANYCMRISAKRSTKIITHSKEGVEFISDKYNLIDLNKVLYMPHPVYLNSIIDNSRNEITWDYIIWGTISKYKGILEFLTELSNSSFTHGKKILVCGYCPDSNYLKKIRNYESSDVTIIEGFLEEVELSSYIARSTCILFLYQESTVLSSGALIKSLSYKKQIIGPNIAAFKDLKELELIDTYVEYDDIFKININNNKMKVEKINTFVMENNWDNFATNLLKK